MYTHSQITKPVTQPSHLSEKALARRWGISDRTLQRMRKDGSGPVYLRIRNAVRYALDDILSYEARLRRSNEDWR